MSRKAQVQRSVNVENHERCGKLKHLTTLQEYWRRLVDFLRELHRAERHTTSIVQSVGRDGTWWPKPRQEPIQVKQVWARSLGRWPTPIDLGVTTSSDTQCCEKSTVSRCTTVVGFEHQLTQTVSSLPTEHGVQNKVQCLKTEQHCFSKWSLRRV